MRTTLLLFALAVSACDRPPPAAPAEHAPNALTDAERAAGWRLLFDGETLDGWRGTYREDVPPGRWRAADGALMVTGEGEGFASIITQDAFTDFDLRLEFKIEAGANSGIKYTVREREEPTPGRGLGLEYQIWDDEQPREADKQMAALYDLIPAEDDQGDKPLRPLGAWNEARIVVRGDSVEHWLNGTRVVAYDRGSDDFRARLAESKYADIPGFAYDAPGHILLQDEGGHRVWFRSIKVCEPSAGSCG